MGARYLTGLADVLRAHGLDVVEVDGWQTRARGSGGYDGTAPWCVMWHHTASNTTPENDVNYICYGCPDAPVANLYLARDGVVWVCAAGATNTNGKGGPYMTSSGVVPVDRMNEYAVSIEAANDGLGEVWQRSMIDAYFAVSLAVTNMLALPPDDVCVHSVWAPDRKIDPARADAVDGPWAPRSTNTSGTWNLDDVIDELWLRSSDQPDPIPPSEDEQMLYYDVTGANAKFIGNGVVVRWTGPGDDRVGAATETQLAAGNLVRYPLTGGPNAFAACWLDGPLPTGDSLHNWTGDEFANAAQIKAGTN